MINVLQLPALQELIDDFNSHLRKDRSFSYWLTYLEMVETLLDFQRANRDGMWKLHVGSFAKMLPCLTIFDHTNYS